VTSSFHLHILQVLIHPQGQICSCKHLNKYLRFYAFFCWSLYYVLTTQCIKNMQRTCTWCIQNWTRYSHNHNATDRWSISLLPVWKACWWLQKDVHYGLQIYSLYPSLFHWSIANLWAPNYHLWLRSTTHQSPHYHPLVWSKNSPLIKKTKFHSKLSLHSLNMGLYCLVILF
jgi:hypothetical protein